MDACTLACWSTLSIFFFLRIRRPPRSTLCQTLFPYTTLFRSGARDLPIQLYGSRTTGWGLTNSSLSIPGPSLAVEVGDNVTLNLTSFDGNRHNWYIDYNSNSAVDANETSSSSPSTRGNVVWNFTVSNRTGTFVYRSRIAGDGNMWGNITISTAGGFGTILGNPLVVIGMVVVFGAILAIAIWAYRRPRHPPEPPQSQ